MTFSGGAAASGGPRKLSERATPVSLVALSSAIELMDGVVELCAVYKVETIGSEYMVVSGLPAACPQPRNTAQRMLRVGVAIIEALRTSNIEDHSRQLDAPSSAPLRDLLDAPTALAACCGFDLCHKYILYLYLYLYLSM